MNPNFIFTEKTEIRKNITYHQVQCIHCEYKVFRRKGQFHRGCQKCKKGKYIKNEKCCINCSKTTTNPKFCSSNCAATFNNKKYIKRKKEGLCEICYKTISSSRRYCDSCKHNINKEKSCINCQKLTTNPKFCSKSCAMTFNNKHNKKHKKLPLLKKCATCETMFTGRNINCEWCILEKKKNNILTLTKKESYSNGKYGTEIRTLARQHFNKTNICKICGYNKHTEIHHIKPISEFDDNATVAEINAESNLIELCPNCHWEVGKGLINLKETII